METSSQVHYEMQEQRLVIAIDYGTTYTGVAIATPVSNRAVLHEIDIIQDWGPSMGNHDKIPSVISYSIPSRHERQWGTDLSPEAVAMVHTKLQLDVDYTSAELDLILETLDGIKNMDFRYITESGGNPAYPCKGPEQIVEDYLRKVFEYLHKALLRFTEEYLRETPVDIIATIPATWGYRAKSSIFRALTGAGFTIDSFPRLKDMILVSEQEAAAIYTARYLKETDGAEFLKKGECFILCDAGGGTVDVVSYKVNRLQPTFEIEQVTVPTGDKCGAIFINLAFKEWLRDLIGDGLYQELDQSELVRKISSHDSEGERMRELMKHFDVHKRRFHTDEDNPRNIRIDLPEPFHNLNLDTRVVGGEITIKYSDMQAFFEPCVTRILELIQGQNEQLEGKRTRVQHVFLVGGFAESLYLQECIKSALIMRDLMLRVPDTSWTAVVRGAAIYGIEKTANKTLSTMSSCSKNFGVTMSAPYSAVAHNRKDLVIDSLSNTALAKDQLMWPIKKGDLILSNQPLEVMATFTVNFKELGPRTGSVPLYSYSEDDPPDRLFIADTELTMFHIMKYDLKDIPMEEFTRVNAATPNPPFYVASLTLTMRLVSDILRVELHFKDRLICLAEKDISEPQVHCPEGPYPFLPLVLQSPFSYKANLPSKLDLIL